MAALLTVLRGVLSEHFLAGARRSRYIQRVHDLCGGAGTAPSGTHGAFTEDGGLLRQVDFATKLVKHCAAVSDQGM